MDPLSISMKFNLNWSEALVFIAALAFIAFIKWNKKR